MRIPLLPPNCRVDAVDAVSVPLAEAGNGDTTRTRPSGSARYGSAEVRTTVTPLLKSSSDDAFGALVSDAVNDAMPFELEPP